MNLLDFIALKLTNGKCIKFFNVKKLAGLGDLPVKLFNLLWEGYLVLLLLGCELVGYL